MKGEEIGVGRVAGGGGGGAESNEISETQLNKVSF